MNKPHFKEMSLVDHLDELRSSLIKIVVIIFVGFILSYNYSDRVTDILLVPLKEAMANNGQIIFLSVFDKVNVQMQLSFWSSIILTSPLWFWQIWNFIRPGLFENEIKVIRPFLIVGFFLFCGGVLFSYKIVFPFGIKLLLSFGTQEITANISFAEYIVLTIKVLVAFGVLFQIPNAMVILGFLEIVTKQSLAKMRRYIYLGLTVVSGIITPPDVFSQLILLVPLVLLYEIGILAVSFIVHPYLHKKYAA